MPTFEKIAIEFCFFYAVEQSVVVHVSLRFAFQTNMLLVDLLRVLNVSVLKCLDAKVGEGHALVAFFFLGLNVQALLLNKLKNVHTLGFLDLQLASCYSRSVSNWHFYFLVRLVIVWTSNF